MTTHLVLQTADIPFTADPVERKRIKEYVTKQFLKQEKAEVIEALVEAVCLAAAQGMLAGRRSDEP